MKRIRNWSGRLKGYGGCIRCGDRWTWKKRHTLMVPSLMRGISALCKECWSELSVEERKLWVNMRIDTWNMDAARTSNPSAEVKRNEQFRKLAMKEIEKSSVG